MKTLFILGILLVVFLLLVKFLNKKMKQGNDYEYVPNKPIITPLLTMLDESGKKANNSGFSKDEASSISRAWHDPNYAKISGFGYLWEKKQ